jgi:hypothetical protein
MPEGATFPEIEPFEPLAAKFTTLWYSSDMGKQWQSNTVFHTYYLQLRRAIESFPRMTSNTLDRFRPLMKFRADRHFIYITACADESKEELQYYYKLTTEDLEEIIKDWPAELLIPADPAELSDPDLIGNPVVTREEYDAPSSSRKKKKQDVQEVHNTSEETASESPSGGGDDEVNKEEKEQEEDKQGEVTPPQNLPDDTDPSKKRKVSPMKPSSWKKSKSNKPKMQNVLTVDDFDFIISAVGDASEEILQRNEAKQEAMYDRIEAELRGVQQALYSSRAVSTAPPPSEEPELGDEPAQLRRLADVTEARLHRAQAEKDQATVALKQAQEEVIEQCRIAQQEKDALQAKFEEERAQIQQEKEKLLVEQVRVKEAVNRALRSVMGLEQKEEEPVEHQVAQLAETIQQLQQRITDLELRTVPSTLQDVRDQREVTARGS